MKRSSDIIEPIDSSPAGDGTASLSAAQGLRVAGIGSGRLRDFYELTKPRMNFLVLCTTAVGFYMAPRVGGAAWMGLIHTLLGTALTAASAAALNHYAERAYDALMPRTRNRPVPAGKVTPAEALGFGVILGIAGVGYLAASVNVLTSVLGAFTLLSYVLVYTPLKRVTSLNTVVGAVPGAIPPVMGWCAATNALTLEALALFAVLFLWQMPHFLAIAIMYRRDYEAGGFKMLPVVDPGLRMTCAMIVLYGLALIPASLFPVGLGMAGTTYLMSAMLLDVAFLAYCIGCAQSRGERTDARKLFFASIIYLPLLLAAMMVDKV